MRSINSLITVLALSFTSFSVGCATSDTESTDEFSDAESNASAPGKLDLWQSTDGQWRFHVVSGNGRTLMTSEGYTSRTGALNGVLSVLDNGVDPAMYALNQTESGRYSLHLSAANHESIAFTQAYSTKSSATRAITSCVNAITSYLDRREANTTGARVEVLEARTGYRFNLHAQNGEIILSSEQYTTPAAAWNGAFAVQTAAATASSFVVHTSTDGAFYFTLSAQNGEIVGVSELYTTKSSAETGIQSTKSVIGSIDLI